MKKIYLLGAAFLISLGITGCTPATTATPPASKPASTVEQQEKEVSLTIYRPTEDAMYLVPVTVKMRLGWSRDTENCVELARAVEEAGAQAITVHGRTREDFYQGEADWAMIAKVVSAVHIPVTGNVDVVDGPSAKRLMEETGCAAVAIGRAAWGNPWIFKAVDTYLETGEIMDPPSWEMRLAMSREHLHGLVLEKGEYAAVREMRAHASRYFNGLPQATALRREIMKALTEKEYNDTLDRYEEEKGLLPSGGRGRKD